MDETMECHRFAQGGGVKARTTYLQDENIKDDPLDFFRGANTTRDLFTLVV